MNEALRPYGPGKFNTVVDSWLYQSLDTGADDELTPCEGEWIGKVNGNQNGLGYRDGCWLDLTNDETTFLANQIGAILFEASNGFVTVEYFGDRTGFEERWTELEDAVYNNGEE